MAFHNIMIESLLEYVVNCMKPQIEIIKQCIETNEQLLLQHQQMRNNFRSFIKSPATMNKMLAFENRIKSEIQKYRDKLKSIDNLKNDILSIENETHRELMVKRYIEGKSWLKISEEMHYYETYVYKLHRDALKSIDLK